MGFWAWLLGKNKNVENEEFTTPASEAPSAQASPKENIPQRKRYQPVQRTKETKDFVQSLVKKSQSKEPLARPHQDTVDQKSVEKFVGKMQGRD